MGGLLTEIFRRDRSLSLLSVPASYFRTEFSLAGATQLCCDFSDSSYSVLLYKILSGSGFTQVNDT